VQLSQTIPSERCTSLIWELLDETFEKVSGIYLDRGTSLFETLATVTTAEAARPISSQCASLAAQVKHVRYYLDVLMVYMRGQKPEGVDWPGSWEVPPVTDAVWRQLQDELRASYQALREQCAATTNWDDEDAFGAPFAMIVHTAYHLGEIRQALGVLRG
jgi:hypothetical protein